MPTHAEKRILPFKPEQLFQLVADVEKYPEFLPWCMASRLRHKSEDKIIADLIIGYKFIRERFASEVTLTYPHRIDVKYQEGPFQHLNNHWCFNPLPTGECEIDFYVDFEFHAQFFQNIIKALFDEAVKHMIKAFEARAHALYGLSAEDRT